MVEAPLPQVGERWDEFAARLIVEDNSGLTLVLRDSRGAQATPDYELISDEESLGWLEVGRLTDTEATANQAAFEKHGLEPIEERQLINSWIVMAASTNWFELRRSVVEPLRALEIIGEQAFSPHDERTYRRGWPHWILRTLGVTSASTVASLGGVPRVYLTRASGFTTGLNPDSAVAYVTDWLRSDLPDPTGVRAKLGRHSAREKHAFLWTDMNGPPLAWRPLWEGTPVSEPQLPPSITSLWLIHNRGYWWSAQSGWQEVMGIQRAVKIARTHFLNDKVRWSD